MRRQAIFITIAVGLAGCGTTPRRISPHSDTPSELKATVGAELTIRLPSNPSTGYSWQMAEGAPALLEPVNTEYVPVTGAHRLGAGGIQVFTFRAIAVGRADLLFIYVRPWEKDQPPVETHTFHVIVD